ALHCTGAPRTPAHHGEERVSGEASRGSSGFLSTPGLTWPLGPETCRQGHPEWGLAVGAVVSGADVDAERQDIDGAPAAPRRSELLRCVSLLDPHDSPCPSYGSAEAPRTPALSPSSSAKQAFEGVWAGSGQKWEACLLLGVLGAPSSLFPSTLPSGHSVGESRAEPWSCQLPPEGHADKRGCQP
ncbi:hypothetical protein E2I00_009295, partial [Balaenoptera physalus]